jgi:hypothetical protein
MSWYHTQTRIFKLNFEKEELKLWIDSFAKHYSKPIEWQMDCFNHVLKLLKDVLINKYISATIEIMTDPDKSVSCICTNVPIEEDYHHMKQTRDEFDKHTALKFMQMGEAGRINFKVQVQSEIDNDNDELLILKEIVLFEEEERAPLINSTRFRFRRSFPLSIDYELMCNVQLWGDSPKEELSLFVNRSSVNNKTLSAVVSLLTTEFIGTAFRVTPSGGMITCHHNTMKLNNDTSAELYIHEEVVSKSFQYAASRKKIATHVTNCQLPELINALDPEDDTEIVNNVYDHSDIAFIQSGCCGNFLIPCAQMPNTGDTVLCIGYPGNYCNTYVKGLYRDLEEGLRPDKEDFDEIFAIGNLSVSPGPVLSRNENVMACEVATIRGFSGSPLCLLSNPKLFAGIHYRGRKQKNYGISVAVSDPGFVNMYTTLALPQLRRCNISDEDKMLVNLYLTNVGVDVDLHIA